MWRNGEIMDNMIGKRIRDRRKELHITQTQIQQETSVSSGNLSCIENGKYLPSALALIELSRILDCSIDWMLTGESKISNNSDISDPQIANLIEYYKQMSSDDQEDILLIAQMKANKGKRTQNIKSSLSAGDRTA